MKFNIDIKYYCIVLAENIFWYQLKKILILIFLALKVFTYAQSNMFTFGNNRPVADAGANIKTLPEGSIFLDGSRSFIGDGSKIKYFWSFAPGLALKSENDLSTAISVETYGAKFLKSISTFEPVLNLKTNYNEPGTKLEVILTISDRIGFEDSDTLIVEYYKPRNREVPKQVLNQSIQSSQVAQIPVNPKKDPSGIFVQGINKNKIDKVDGHIINSIIKDQVSSVGFGYNVYLEKDIKDQTGAKIHECKTEMCIAKNARSLNVEYVISWEFSDSMDKLSMKVYDPKTFDTWIDKVKIDGPYRMMSQSGVYGLESSLRYSVSKIMGAKQFRDNISIFDRLLMKNERMIYYGRYPVMIAMTYFFFNSLISEEEPEQEPELPPGFPHSN